jgi:hypothetical protein
MRRSPYRAIRVEDLLAADRLARRRRRKIFAFILVVVLVWLVFRCVR